MAFPKQAGRIGSGIGKLMRGTPGMGLGNALRGGLNPRPRKVLPGAVPPVLPKAATVPPMMRTRKAFVDGMARKTARPSKKMMGY